MKYIILAGRGGNTEVPRQLWKIGYETVIGRTIRLLKKNGVKDIAISTHNKQFERYGLKLLKHHNDGPWINAFYPTDEPVCYIFGDVVFSEEAIKVIVGTETDSIQFFGSAPPFAKEYPKRWAEPFAFKVVDTKYFFECVQQVREGIQNNKWRRDPIAWELWQVIKKTPWNKIDYTNFIVINDFTCDVDEPEDLVYYKDMGKFEETPFGTKPHYMIHACPDRMWYVEKYLIPSMLEQGINKEQIDVYVDQARLKNLKACMNSYLTLPEEGGTWHLQDDVIISRDFKKQTEKHDSGYIAGFISQHYNPNSKAGVVSLRDMPFSFPCIRIPNKAARECAEWVLQYIVGNPVYTQYTKDGNGDDWAFRLYAQSFLKDKMCYNLQPSIVDHVDWLIGGSAVGTKRKEPTRARYFEDLDLVEELRRQLWRGSQQTKESM